mmetsp:Transcript_24096/g.39514  ORF Transcript_24096/g.39514 Transcript_24096/m.39514 type:complete len:400 (+) Transcript_24096:114-1313(+)
MRCPQAWHCRRPTLRQSWLLHTLVLVQALERAALFEPAYCLATDEVDAGKHSSHEALRIAARAGHAQAVHEICAHVSCTQPPPSDSVHGASGGVAVIELRDHMLRTPLHAAAHKGHASVVAALLAWRADVEAQDGGLQTPLHCAAQRGHLPAVEQLLKGGADAISLDNRGRMPLHLMAYWGHPAVLEALLLRGDGLEHWLDQPDNGGEPPLHLAARQGHVAAVSRLLVHRADATTLDRFNRSVLHKAVTARHAAVVHRLLEGRAAVHAHDSWGRTALHYAARFRSVEAAKLLMIYGADANIRTGAKVTPRMEAEETKHKQIIQILDGSWSRSCPFDVQFRNVVNNIFGAELPSHLAGYPPHEEAILRYRLSGCTGLESGGVERAGVLPVGSPGSASVGH